MSDQGPWNDYAAPTALPPMATPLNTKPWDDYGAPSIAQGSNARQNIPTMTAFSAAQELTPWNQVKEATFGKAGEKIAELGGREGQPELGAILGTGVSMMPDTASAMMGFEGIGNSENPIVKGLTSTPQEVGEAMNAGEKEAGIASDTLPVRRGTLMKFPGLDGLPQNEPPPEAPTVAPTVYPKDTATFLNIARQRIDSLGEQMQPQELADYRVILNNMIRGGEVKAGTKPFALASQLYTDANSLFTQAVAGRTDLNEVYKYAKMMPSIGDAIGTATKKYGPLVLRGLMEGAGVGAAWQGIKHLF